MKTIKVVFSEDGSMQPVEIDFKVYRGEYNQVELMVYIPKSLLLDTVTDENGNLRTGNILKVGAIIHKANGQAYTTKEYIIPVLEEQRIDNITYAIYCRRLPKEFTLWDTVATELGQRGELQMVINILSTQQEQDKTLVESILTSPVISIPVYPSVYLSADEAIETDKLDELAGNIDSLRLTLQNDMATKVELNAVDTNKVDKVQAEEGKVLLSNGIGGIQASNVTIQEYEDQKAYIDQLHIEQEQRMDSMQEEITANTDERHIHTNKEILDGYTVPNNALLESVDKMHEHSNKEILNNITEAFTTELKGNVEGSITNVELDGRTGIFTFTKNNGERIKVDTLLEKVIVNFRFDKERQALILISEDGTEQEVELGALLSLYKGTDGAEIVVTVDRDNNIGASIKEFGVTEGKIGDFAVTDRKIGNGAVTEIKLHQTILDKFTQLQAEIEAIKADREQIIKDSWLYHHPVGSAILTYSTKLSPDDKEFDPNDKGGVWELERAGFALWTTEGTDAVGTKNADGTTNTIGTIAAGLPNITGAIWIKSAWQGDNGEGALHAYQSDEKYTGGQYQQTIINRVDIDASRTPNNTVYGKSTTVQPPAVKIKLWRRKA